MGKMGVASALAKAQVLLGPGILPCSWVAATLRVFYGREGAASRGLEGGVPAGMRAEGTRSYGVKGNVSSRGPVLSCLVCVYTEPRGGDGRDQSMRRSHLIDKSGLQRSARKSREDRPGRQLGGEALPRNSPPLDFFRRRRDRPGRGKNSHAHYVCNSMYAAPFVSALPLSSEVLFKLSQISNGLFRSRSWMVAGMIGGMGPALSCLSVHVVPGRQTVEGPCPACCSPHPSVSLFQRSQLSSEFDPRP